jgi:hypothetical protein
MTSKRQLIADAAEALDLFGDDILEDFAVRKCPRCPHGNVYEECPQCDSDARLGVDSSVLDQVPNDDPDMGLDDRYAEAMGIFEDMNLYGVDYTDYENI